MGDAVLGPYRKSWKECFLGGCVDMAAVQSEGECTECRAERGKRHRVMSSPVCLARDIQTDLPVRQPCTLSTCPGTLQLSSELASLLNNKVCSSHGVTPKISQCTKAIAI